MMYLPIQMVWRGAISVSDPVEEEPEDGHYIEIPEEEVYEKLGQRYPTWDFNEIERRAKEKYSEDPMIV